MKGISALISVILLLMIVTVLAGLAYVWFTNIFQLLSSSAEQSATGASQTLATQFRIEVAKNITGLPAGTYKVKTTIRNTGTQNIDMTKIAGFIDDEIKTVELGPSVTTLVPGNITTFNVTSTTTYSCTSILKLTGAGGVSDSVSITC